MKTHILLIMLLGATTIQSQTLPQESWLAYNDVSEAGFSSAKLAEAQSYYDSIGFGAALVIHKGAVVASWGENTRRFMLASMRKSLLNAMIGRAIDEGRFQLSTTLSELGIDDKTPLTETEKSATVAQLLTTTSGIYLPSAFEFKGWKERKPERGIHQPGEVWYYNNWDFNALCTIYEKTTGKGFLEAFRSEIAMPLGMEDLRPIDALYYYEPETEHPAYLYKMSSRDLGRFGMLYLNDGKWDNQQLVPRSWVASSTAAQVNAFEGHDYGYLWWPKEVDGHSAYTARGAGRHTLTVIPDLDMVIVVRTNDYNGRPLQRRENEQLETLVVNAKTGASAQRPALAPMDWYIRETPEPIANHQINASIVGQYLHPMFGQFTVERNASELTMLTTPARFRMIPTGADAYYIEDAGMHTVFRPSDDPELTGKIKMEAGDNGRVLVFYYPASQG
ncbi:MAG: serine hydrolase [Cyclobacteriaceae bacterium]